MLRAATAAAVLVTAFTVYAVLARSVLHGRATGHALLLSVQDASGAAGHDGRCRRAGAVWSCAVGDRGGVRYRVQVGADGSCWRGRLAGARAPERLPARIRGCVRRWPSGILE